jgi:hypothetical protein
LEKISRTSKENITYLGMTLHSEFDPKTLNYSSSKKLYKPGKSKNGWDASIGGREIGYRPDKHFNLLNIHRGIHEPFFLKIARSRYTRLIIDNSKEYFIYTDDYLLEAYKTFLFPKDIEDWLDECFFQGSGYEIKIPNNLIQKIKTKFEEFPGNMSSWDKKRCINILNYLFGMVKNHSHPLMPGRNISALKYDYRYDDDGFIDTKKIRNINFSFGGEYYPDRTIVMDLFPCLECNVLYNEEEKNLGKDIATAKVFSPDSNPYPSEFCGNVTILMEELLKESKITDIRIPWKKWQRFQVPNNNPFDSMYFPAFIDSDKKLIGVDGLSIVTILEGTEYLGNYINELIEKSPLII